MLELEERGKVTILHMARGKGNSLNLEFCIALVEVLDRLETAPTRAVVLTGQGSVFGAGVDLPALLAGGAPYIREFLPVMQRAFERLAMLPKPVVAAVNGHAIAGGAILALACDLRLMATGTARFGLTEVLVGVVFPAWALEIARFATPPQYFQTAIITGRTWNPEDSLARGFVDELVEPEGLLDRACEVAAEMGAVLPSTFATTKRAVRRPMVEAAHRIARETDAAVLAHWCSPQVLQQIEEFAARTIKRRE